MRSVLFVLTACAVIALAFWAYRENYRTQQALNVTEQLQRDIGASRARLAVLRAEWAYLNRPDRLRDLADLNFDSLGLMPMAPAQFGRIDQVAFPLAEEGLLPITDPITDPIDVSNMEVRP